MVGVVLNAIRRSFLHIYRTLLNRHSLFGLLRHILVNLTFILIWITTFKNAWRIESSVRPEIDVEWLEAADHAIFDITVPRILIQAAFSAAGYAWMYALTRRTKLSMLAALPPLLLNITLYAAHLMSSHGYPTAYSLDLRLVLRYPKLSRDHNAPLFPFRCSLVYPLPRGNYPMPGSAAGLVRVDAVLGTHIYTNAFKASPLVFGAFPSLHGAFSCCCFFFVARYSRTGAFVMGFYVMWQWFSTMYLRHHWRIDLLGGLIYSAFAFSLFYTSLAKIDKLYGSGVSGGNGWQRLFEGTRLQYTFDRMPEVGYNVLLVESGDEESGRLSFEMTGSKEVESSWIQD